jgi:hypothetical protein
MYCPQCGQERGSEEIRFCSRCGFPLMEVTGLVERGGAPEDLPQSPRRRGLKQGAFVILSMLAMLILLAAGDFDPDFVLSVALLGGFAGLLRMIYALAFQSGSRSRPIPVPPVAVPKRVEAPRRAPLPPADTNQAAVPRARFDTGDLAEPPSVTEHTTRHMERER